MKKIILVLLIVIAQLILSSDTLHQTLMSVLPIFLVPGSSWMGGMGFTFLVTVASE